MWEDRRCSKHLHYPDCFLCNALRQETLLGFNDFNDETAKTSLEFQLRKFPSDEVQNLLIGKINNDNGVVSVILMFSHFFL